jgi:hypothetical protein
MNIGVVISTSPTEKRFTRAQLKECAKFATHTVVCLGSHRYDGITPEPIDTFLDIIVEFPDVQFVVYTVKPKDEFYNPLQSRPGAYWHNVARIAGTQKLPQDVNWVMYLDGDEIPDGELMCEWMNYTSDKVRPTDVFYLANYWYFKDPTMRAMSLEESIPVVCKAILGDNDNIVRILMNDNERFGFKLLQGVTIHNHVVSPSGTPMLHHYSWVRTKDDLLKKVCTWGHAKDKPWKQMVEDSWGESFVSRDFVHGYIHTPVSNRFSI